MPPRGGQQRIPRPPSHRPGRPAPWAHVDPSGRHLTLDDIRARLSRVPPGAAAAPRAPGSVAAAVLVPLFEADGDVSVILTKRPETMPSHQGEIAFPGGKHDPALDPGLQATALREAREEIGLDPDEVEIVARLEGISTVASRFVITPFVGFLTSRPELTPDPREVTRVFEVTLSELMADGVYREERWDGPSFDFDVHFYELADETVWGATRAHPDGLPRAPRDEPLSSGPAFEFRVHLRGVPVPRPGRPILASSIVRGGGVSVEVEIGIGKTGRRAYGFDDIAIVPSRRTRDPEDVDITWEVDAYKFGLPMMAAAMDGVVSPTSAIEIGRLGGLACLNLEGLWTRYEDPEAVFEEIASLPSEKATRRMQELYDEPIKPELIAPRIREIKAGGVTACASLTPQRVEQFSKIVLDAELDVLVVQGTVVSAEHVSKDPERQPLNLKKFIREFDLPVIVGGCASYSTALHLMRTGAVGVLVGVGPGHACTSRGVLGIGVPQATAIADAAGARIRHLDETGVYVHVIADGGMRTGGDIAKAIACGADAVMIGSPLASAYESPGRGFHWGMATFHPTLPRGARVEAGRKATLAEILVGPAHENDGTLNLFGALRTSMATTGYETVKEFQKAEVMVAPALKTEGKSLQRAQGIGMA